MPRLNELETKDLKRIQRTELDTLVWLEDRRYGGVLDSIRAGRVQDVTLTTARWRRVAHEVHRRTS